MGYTIVTYQPHYKDQIAELILSIQQGEFNVPITLADQPDLLNIENFYQKDHGNFWCALDETQNVVGTIALIDIGHESGVIRKMFVHANHRGGEARIAQQLLDILESHARSSGILSIYLGTIDRLQAANRFYLRNGYNQIIPEQLPDYFPRMKVDNVFFSKTL